MGLAFVELIMEVEHHFGIDIPDKVAGTLRTPRALIDHVCSKVASQPTPRLREEVGDRVREMIRAQSGVVTFSDDADFIRDLDMG